MTNNNEIIKCALTGKQQQKQYMTRLTSGEYIDLETHHIIMMEEKNYFYNYKTALKHYNNILEESNKARKILTILRNHYLTKPLINQKLQEFKQKANSESIRLERKTFECLDRTQVIQYLNMFLQELKTSLGSSYDSVNRGSGKQTYYNKILNDLIPQHELIL
jgi:galactose-1-phosphate uridylyltransferase